nr:hypothetical protein [Tanacetum cinerariifolium]
MLSLLVTPYVPIKLHPIGYTAPKMKVIKEGFKKLGSLMINADSFSCNTSLGTIFKEFSRLSGMDDDLFTYEVGIPRLSSISCDKKKRMIRMVAILILVRLIDVTIEQWLDLIYGDHKNVDVKKQWVPRGIDDDMEYDPSDVEFVEWMNGWGNGKKEYHGFRMNHGLKMEFPSITFIISANLSASRMGKLNGPLAIQMMKDSEEDLKQKAIYEWSWGDATQEVMNFCAWLKRCFENFHELDYELLVKLKEYWWNINDLECSPFTRRNHINKTYVNTNIIADYNLYLDVSRTFNNHEERDDDETIEEEKEPNDDHGIGNLDYDLVKENASYHTNEEEEQDKEDRCELLGNLCQEPPVCEIRSGGGLILYQAYGNLYAMTVDMISQIVGALVEPTPVAVVGDANSLAIERNVVLLWIVLFA